MHCECGLVLGIKHLTVFNLKDQPGLWPRMNGIGVFVWDRVPELRTLNMLRLVLCFIW